MVELVNIISSHADADGVLLPSKQTSDEVRIQNESADPINIIGHGPLYPGEIAEFKWEAGAWRRTK